MKSKQVKRKPPPAVPDRPVRPGSALYRLLEMVANAVAAKLVEPSSERLRRGRDMTQPEMKRGGGDRVAGPPPQS
jgi:hypothetical protein